MSTLMMAAPTTPKGLDHRTVWRWHFYAGLFCIPFVLWLSVTGTIFLFHPQIQHWLDRPYDHLSIAQRTTANAQVQAALAAVPGTTFDSYQLPSTSTSAAQVLVDEGTQQFRIYIHPQTAAVLKIDNEDHRIDVFMSRLHGELLLLGKYGSWLVELAASWAVVMILTGLFLWWPREHQGVAGVLYPRLHAGGRTFWKDIHSVTGIWVSTLALLLLFTGLPWAKAWGGYLKAIRHISAGRVVQQDWTISSADDLAARARRSASSQLDTSGMSTMHDMPGMPTAHHMEGMPNMSAADHAQHLGFGRHATTLTGPNAFVALDTMVATVAPLDLPNPVLISPPMRADGNWTAKSDTRDRPLRVDLVLDRKTGAVLRRTDFHSKPWLDRFIGVGIAAHEGQLFGLLNQLVSVATVIGLVTLSVSGLILWWRRRPEGVLGAPAPQRKVRFSAALALILVALGLYFPFLGVSMILVALTERLLLRRIPATQRWLGLQPAGS